jgi:Transposase DDE domain
MTLSAHRRAVEHQDGRGGGEHGPGGQHQRAWPQPLMTALPRARCRPVTRILTPGQHGDCPQFIPLLEAARIARRGTSRPRTRPGRAMADKAYSSAANRAYLRRRGIRAVIPVKEDQKNNRRARERDGGRPPAFDPDSTRSAIPSSAVSASYRRCA